MAAENVQYFLQLRAYIYIRVDRQTDRQALLIECMFVKIMRVLFDPLVLLAMPVQFQVIFLSDWKGNQQQDQCYHD